MDPTPGGARPAPTIRRFPPGSKINVPPGNRQHDIIKLGRLKASIEAMGQQVAGQVCDDPDRPGEFLVVSGAGRLWCCQQLGIDFVAQYIEGSLSPEQVIERRLVEDLIREAMSPPELAADFTRLMKIRGCSQAELADSLNISPATVSRVMSIKRLAPDLLPMVEDFTLCPSVAYLIAGLPTLDLQRQVAHTTIENKLTRDAVQKLCDRHKKGNKAGRPAKLHDIPRPSGSVIAGLRLRADGDVKEGIEEAKYLLAVLEKHGAHGMETVISILRNRGKGDRPAA